MSKRAHYAYNPLNPAEAYSFCCPVYPLNLRLMFTDMRLILAALCVLLLLGTGGKSMPPRPNPPPHLGQKQTVVTRNPKIGVHLRLSGTDDESALAEQLGQVREMGATWVVDLF